MPRGVSRYDEARLQGRLWTPRQIASKLAIWIDASDIGTITGASGKVSAIKDVRRNGQGLTQATSGNQLTWNPIGFGGRKPALIGATNCYMSITNTFTSAAGTGVFAVQGMATATAPSLIGGANDGALMFRWIGSNPDIVQSFQVDVLPATNLSATATSLNVLGYDASSTATAAYLNGKSQTGSGGSFTGVNDGFFHDHFVADSSWVGAFGEAVIAASGVLPTRDRLRVEGYLAWKWGVTLDASHRFSKRPPLIGD